MLQTWVKKLLYFSIILLFFTAKAQCGCCFTSYKDFESIVNGFITTNDASSSASAEPVPEIIDYGPIDIVYTWVNGADPDWVALRNQYLVYYKPIVNNPDSIQKNRYRNRDELKYSLRSIYQFAPFVNHIYVVTANQVPSWFKPHPKITIINHSEIFQNKLHLPSFNSQAIEANLHHIPGLSEKYIYLNDDVFLGSYVQPSDFFAPNGDMKVFYANYISASGSHVSGEQAFRSAWRNTNAFLDAQFTPEPREALCHAPDVFNKSVVLDFQERFPEIFEIVSSHKFRLSTSFVLTNGLLQYFSKYTNRSTAGNIVHNMITIGSDPIRARRELMGLLETKCQTFCIEDVAKRDNEEVDALLREFLEICFPNPAPWELDTHRE